MKLLLAAIHPQLKAPSYINRLMDLQNIQLKGRCNFNDPCETFLFTWTSEARCQSCLREGRSHLGSTAVPIDETGSLNCRLPWQWVVFRQCVRILLAKYRWWDLSLTDVAPGQPFRRNSISGLQSDDSQNQTVVAKANSGILSVHGSGTTRPRPSLNPAFAENSQSMGSEAKPQMREECVWSDYCQMAREFLRNDDQITPPSQ
jgi:hypothetical protein